MSLFLLPLTAFAQSADQEVVSVVDSPDPVAPGATLSYTVTVRNNGPNSATNGGININLPLSVTHTTDVTPPGWTCFWAGSNGTCNTPTFTVGTEVVTINVTVGASLASFPDQTISATFYPSGTTPDPNNGNNSKTANTLVDSPQVDLTVSASDSPDPVSTDGTVTYTVNVSNDGPDTASNVNFNVVPNSNLTFQSATAPAGWSCTLPSVGAYNATFSCSRASFPVGNGTFTIAFNANDEQFGINDTTFQTNFNIGAGASNETDNSDNSTTLTTSYVTPDADISIAVVDSPDPVFPDGNITYTVTVANNGPDAAPTVNLSSFGSNNLRFVSATVPAGWNCSLPAAGAQTPGYSCTLPTGLANGASSVLTFVMQADDALIGPFDTTLQFGFLANSNVSDPVNGNNSETESTAYVTPDADIAITVSDSPDPVAPDGNITYTVTVSNNGPDAAPSVNLSSFGSNNLRFVSATVPAGWNCSLPAAGAQTPGYNCSLPTSFANGASAVFTFVMQADDALIGPFDTTIQFGFQASSPVTDPVNGNNSETETTAYDVANADLGVTATDSPDPVAGGSNITYSGTITSAGPDTATSVTFTANLAANLLFQSITIPGFSCSTPAVGANGPLSCTIASLANGASVAFTLVAQVNPTVNSGPDGLIQQMFTISAATNDPAQTNNSITVNTNYTTPDANLAVTNTDSPDPVAQGGTITYTQTVTNNGPDAATNASFTTATGAGTTFQSFTAPGGWSCTTPAVGATGSITCTNASFANAGVAVFTLVVNVTGTGSISNTASISSSTYDPNVANNTAVTATNVTTPTSADLSITKTTTASTAPIGSTFSYTIVVTNNGPDAATSVVMTDTLPASLLFRSITQPSPFTCTTPAVGATGTITCNAASLANGASRTFTLVVEVASGASGSIINGASVSSAATDGNSGNSSVSASGVTAAPASADVSIVKSTTASRAVTGTNITYTILVSNAGPSPATNVIVTDDLPAGLTFVSATPSQGTCNASDPVSCNLGTITSGANATITLVANVTASNGTISNTASVSSTEGGGDSSTSPAIPVVITAEFTPVPTLSEWALIALALAIVVLALKTRL
ncbi:MAG: IPTL-CTERM sorting domain-containing protein [Thermoanaerobaculia bacterium]